MAKFIVYACPQGPLAEQLQAYLDQSRERIGRNAAHAYMPHCTLTGFFEDDPRVIPGDIDLLGQLVKQGLPVCPQPSIRVRRIGLQPGWLGLELDAPWVRQLAHDFATSANRGQRSTRISVKNRLHLSLAYDFPPQQQAALEALARQQVDPGAVVNWQICYYQREAVGIWLCHQTWQLPASPSPPEEP
jgi:hypothetical protein